MWDVTSSRTTLDPPAVVHVRLVASTRPRTQGGCELMIAAAPEIPPVRSVGWRMGHPLGAAAGLQGRTIRYTVWVRASASMTLSSGTMSVNDGARRSSAALPAVSRDRRMVSAEHTVSADATRLELWLVLAEGRGIIRPVSERLYVETRVDLVDDAGR